MSVIAPILAGVLAASAVAFAGSVGVRGSLSDDDAPRHLRIRGHVLQLKPGRDRSLRVRIRNPFGVAVEVYRLRADARRGRGPAGRCPARFLRIRTWTGARRIPAGATRSLRLAVRMRRGAPARCDGTRWPIDYVARSQRA